MDHLQKAKKEYKNLNKQKVHYIYQSELDKPYFQHNISYGDFKDLIRRAASEKLLCDKAFNIGKNLKYDGYQCRLVSVVYNEELAKELHKPIIRKFKKGKVHSPFIDSIWGADPADMQLISKFNKGVCF